MGACRCCLRCCPAPTRDALVARSPRRTLPTPPRPSLRIRMAQKSGKSGSIRCWTFFTCGTAPPLTKGSGWPSSWYCGGLLWPAPGLPWPSPSDGPAQQERVLAKQIQTCLSAEGATLAKVQPLCKPALYPRLRRPSSLWARANSPNPVPLTPWSPLPAAELSALLHRRRPGPGVCYELLDAAAAGPLSD